VQPLDKLQRAEFTKEAQQHVQPGFKLVMQEKVDKGLMGGFILEFEDRLVDMSVKKKLEEFNNLVGTVWYLGLRFSVQGWGEASLSLRTGWWT
jgi:hypothetical protein